MSKDKPTLGTEISKYQEEKKTIVIPQVVASEKGRAQTGVACRFGVVGPQLENYSNLHAYLCLKQNDYCPYYPFPYSCYFLPTTLLIS